MYKNGELLQAIYPTGVITTSGGADLAQYTAFRCGVDITFTYGGGAIEETIPAGAVTLCKGNKNINFTAPANITVME
jgi:hypothetical protein